MKQRRIDRSRPRRQAARRGLRLVHVATVRPGAPRAALLAGTAVFACATGRSGTRQAKREGDGASPRGVWPLRRVLWRADRAPRSRSGLPLRPIRPSDGWCDDPAATAYNRPVRLPDRARHERLWRDDRLYDRLVVIGYNDAPAVPGRGSAVFLHVAGPGLMPTEGCIALRAADLARVIARLAPDSVMVIGGCRARRRSR